MFFYSNTTAFLTSLAIIILLMNRSFYGSVAKVTVLEIIVVLDMMGLMAAYWAGSTRKNQTNMFALVLTALVLFVIYVVFAVQLVQKLRAFFPDVVRRRVSVSVLARAARAEPAPRPCRTSRTSTAHGRPRGWTSAGTSRSRSCAAAIADCWHGHQEQGSQLSCLLNSLVASHSHSLLLLFHVSI